MLKARPFRAEALLTSEGFSLSVLTRGLAKPGAVLTSAGRQAVACYRRANACTSLAFGPRGA
jgi:hypothetical protein